ncbi:EcsC family protein [Nocardioides sp. JQ2195]|uniref:EcsC family protein n=1 Tax=Nocardioides sp. JQ2195 TaxID=2592334 RepID=UPI00143ECBB6|nr:EcsC family protein [Nocardioides sp. JQ2195]QIX25236.1 EcsC family protein [Nocardioides sp. JQ2195]
MGIGQSLARRITPKITQAAPGLSHGFVREALKRAIEGAGPLPSVRESSTKKLADAGGDVDKAIRKAIEVHTGYAAAEGFVTNLGGLVTAAATIPANITGLALIQCRLIATIAELRGHDLSDPRVRNAVLLCVIGEDSVKKLVKRKTVPGTPMALATAPVHDPALDKVISTEVATELVSKVAGKRLATTVGRRVPVIGGAVGMTADGWATWRIGRYAAQELLPRARR